MGRARLYRRGPMVVTDLGDGRVLERRSEAMARRLPEAPSRLRHAEILEKSPGRVARIPGPPKKRS